MNRSPDPYAQSTGDYGYQAFVKVAESDTSSSFMELPKEDDGSLLLSTVTGQFPNAVGLKYKSSSGAWRGIRISDNILNAPSGGWGDTLYYITLQKSEASKRKMEATPKEVRSAKSGKRESSDMLEDIIVLGLPFKCTNEDLKDYFTNECGELAFHEVKFDRNTGKARGFGFIRFKSVDGAKKALNNEHTIMGRTLEIRLSKKKEVPVKLFVGRIPNGTTQEDLKKYFADFGEISDAYIPTPFRGFGFVTFASSEEGRLAQRMNHKIQGARLNVVFAEPKEEPRRDGGGGGGGGGGGRGRDDKPFYDNSRQMESRDRGPREPRDNRGPREPRDNRGPREDRDNRDPRGPREDRGPRDDRGPRELRDDRGPRELRDDRGPREPRDDRGPREPRDDRGPREPRDNRGPRDFRDPIERNPMERNLLERKNYFERDLRDEDVRERAPRERTTRERDPRERAPPLDRDPRGRDAAGRDPRERDQRDPHEKDHRERELRERNPRDRDQRERVEMETRENNFGREQTDNSRRDQRDINNKDFREQRDFRNTRERDFRNSHEKTDFRDPKDTRGIADQRDSRSQYQPSNQFDEHNQFNPQYDFANAQPMQQHMHPVPPAGVPPDVAAELKNMIYQFLGTAN